MRRYEEEESPEDIQSNRLGVQNGIDRNPFVSGMARLNWTMALRASNKLRMRRQHSGVDSTLRNDTKVVMFWTSNPTSMWWGTTREGSALFQRCERPCVMTRNKSRITEASVVAFFHVDKRPLWPEVRFDNQSYVHFLNERPGPHHNSLTEYNGRINITWCSRRDADVPAHPVVVPKDTRHRTETYAPRIPLTSKNKSVVWPVSHCNADSKRDIYAHELSKHIGVDIYGKCGTLTCPRSTSCMGYFEQTYKFYLSFENKICKDYITEKFYGLARYEMIPIVMGGGDYDDAAPPHSFINVRDYDSPAELAKYLRVLEQDEEEYYSYFAWKSIYWIVNSNLVDGTCLLCDIAHDISEWQRPARAEYYKWWFGGCDDSLVDKMRAKGNW